MALTRLFFFKRTALNAILGFSEMMKKESLGDLGNPRYLEYAGDIHTSGGHLLQKAFILGLHQGNFVMVVLYPLG